MESAKEEAKKAKRERDEKEEQMKNAHEENVALQSKFVQDKIKMQKLHDEENARKVQEKVKQQKLHDAKREANATRAVSKYLFGLSMGEDGSSTLASGPAAASVGFMTLQSMPLDDYATKFTSALRAYKTALMSTPCVCRQSAVEADVGENELERYLREAVHWTRRQI